MLLIALALIGALFSGGWFALREYTGLPRFVGTPVTVSGNLAASRSLQPRVVMYATSWCPYCARARAFFRTHGIQYIERDVEKDEAAREDFRRFGGGVPLITVGEDLVRGFDERALRRALGPWLEEPSV